MGTKRFSLADPLNAYRQEISVLENAEWETMLCE